MSIGYGYFAVTCGYLGNNRLNASSACFFAAQTIKTIRVCRKH